MTPSPRKLPRRWRKVRIMHSCPGYDLRRDGVVLARVRHDRTNGGWCAEKVVSRMQSLGPFTTPTEAMTRIAELCE